MSNLLKVAMIDLVLSLHRQGLSQRRIATELRINRETVARYLSWHRDAAKPANAPSGSIDALRSIKLRRIQNQPIRPPARLLLSWGKHRAVIVPSGPGESRTPPRS